jgi:2-dehydro-3-deoxyphosphogluconate aldolase/(4S)-4-hydroxy-2-oxoglutarate aldolase
MKETVIRAVEKYKLVAILRGVPEEKLTRVAQALYDGGVRLLEITYSPDGSVSDEETARCIGLLVKEFAGRMYIGAGTVLTREQVRLTKEAGGLFIISPNVDEAVIRETCALGLVSMPGALTPTEICNAHSFGADFVKLFPAGDMGVGYVKSVKAPLSHIKMLAVGGINEKTIASYLRTGVCGFGIGSNIVSKKMVDENDYQGITALAREFVAAIEKG